jgi:hypothetical protein
MRQQELRRWCLEQAIEIIKDAPADPLPTHERLKRVYKRLIELSKHAAEPDDELVSPSTAV